MGCEVVSVYSGEVTGKIGFPEQAMLDLIERGHLQPNCDSHFKRTKSEIKYLHGFSQSYTASALHTVILTHRQYLLYNSLNFIVLLDSANS